MTRGRQDLIEPPRRGQLTHGYIFSGARADSYDDCVVNGLIITARCDIANEKARLFNYLPLVTFRDWWQRDGRILLAERSIKDAYGTMRNLLAQADYDPNILGSVNAATVSHSLFGADDIPAKVAKKKSSFDRAVCIAHVAHVCTRR